MPKSNVSFAGFPKSTLPFLRKLEKNNNREWFEKNKAVYESEVKAPMVALVEAIGAGMLDYAPDFIPEDPRKAVFRIHRDVRFAKDKSPYKTNVAAAFRQQGLGKDEGASFYVHLDNKEFLVAAGIYMPSAELLRKLREHIAINHERLRAIVSDKRRQSVVGGLQGDILTRLPKGYLPGHPAEDLLKRKMYIYWTEMAPAMAETPSALTEVTKRFRAMAPLVGFLNEVAKTGKAWGL
jgi:uncharacterized protein (TIGR02453 family)